MDAIRKYLRNDRFAEHSGVELADLSPGHATARMTITDIHLNAFGSVHGGAIFTLADFAFAAAANSYGTLTVALNVSITYANAAAKGMVLTATAKETSRGPRVATYTVTVTNEHGVLIAQFNGLGYRKKDSLVERKE